MKFGDEIAKWASATQEEVHTQVAQKTRILFTAVIMNSPSKEPTLAGRSAPFAQGTFISNWNIGPRASTEVTVVPSTKPAKVAEINRIINDDFFLNNTTAYITNSLDYADKIEYRGWQFSGPYTPVKLALDTYWEGPAPVARSIATSLV